MWSKRETCRLDRGITVVTRQRADPGRHDDVHSGTSIGPEVSHAGDMPRYLISRPVTAAGGFWPGAMSSGLWPSLMGLQQSSKSVHTSTFPAVGSACTTHQFLLISPCSPLRLLTRMQTIPDQSSEYPPTPGQRHGRSAPPDERAIIPRRWNGHVTPSCRRRRHEPFG
jgi:hypothetical protein